MSESVFEQSTQPRGYLCTPRAVCSSEHAGSLSNGLCRYACVSACAGPGSWPASEGILHKVTDIGLQVKQLCSTTCDRDSRTEDADKQGMQQEQTFSAGCMRIMVKGPHSPRLTARFQCDADFAVFVSVKLSSAGLKCCKRVLIFLPAEESRILHG